MNKFKAGDLVICIDPGSNNYIVKNKVYTVSSSFISKISGTNKKEEMVLLKENMVEYYAFRFILATPAARILYGE